MVHRALRRGRGVQAALDERFGTTDRARIANIVFCDAAELAWLRGWSRPRVRDRYAAWLDGVDADVAVVEIPLLYETGAERLFDAVVVITAPDAIRVARRGAAVDRTVVAAHRRRGEDPPRRLHICQRRLARRASTPLSKPFWGDFELTPKVTLDKCHSDVIMTSTCSCQFTSKRSSRTSRRPALWATRTSRRPPNG